MRDERGIDLTQSGQPRPYADSVDAGTVVADSEEEAREKLAKLCGVSKILGKQDKGSDWSCPYFSLFREDGPGKWQFRIIHEFTG